MFLLLLPSLAGDARAEPPEDALRVCLEVEVEDADRLAEALAVRGAVVVESGGDLAVRIEARTPAGDRNPDSARVYEVQVAAPGRLPTTALVLVPETEDALWSRLLALAILESPLGAPLPASADLPALPPETPPAPAPAPPPARPPAPPAASPFRGPWSTTTAAEILGSAHLQPRLGLSVALEERLHWLRLDQALLVQRAASRATGLALENPEIAVPASRVGLRAGLSAVWEHPRRALAAGPGIEVAWGEPRVLQGACSARAREQIDVSLTAGLELAGRGRLAPLVRLTAALPLREVAYNPIDGTVPLAPSLGAGLGFRVAP